MTIETFLLELKVFRRNTIRNSILYYFAKDYIRKRDDYHAGRVHALSTSRLAVVRMNKIMLPENELMDFLLFCYFLNEVSFKVINVFKRANIHSIDMFFRNDLITVLKNNELTKHIEINMLSECLNFQRKARQYYEVYTNKLSSCLVSKSVINNRSRGQYATDDSFEKEYDLQKLCDELYYPKNRVVTYYSGLLGASDRPRSSHSC